MKTLLEIVPLELKDKTFVNVIRYVQGDASRQGEADEQYGRVEKPVQSKRNVEIVFKINKSQTRGSRACCYENNHRCWELKESIDSLCKKTLTL